MEFSGIIKKMLPVKSGTSQRGQWQCQDSVIEEEGNRYNQSIVFQVFGADKMKSFDLKAGDRVTVSLDFCVNEYQGKYYNRVNCYNVVHSESKQVQPQSIFQPTQQPVLNAKENEKTPNPVPDNEDDTPF